METLMLVLGVCGVGGGGAFYYLQQQAVSQAKQKRQDAAKRAKSKPLALAAPDGHVRKRPADFGRR
jgi:uncharacterized protein HemX